MTLSHDVDGDGPALVLLHSRVCDRRMWDPQWQPLLDAGYRVVRCDFRGFGRSPMPDRPYNNADDFGEREEALIAAGDIDGAVELNVETFVGPEADDTVRDRVREMQRHAFDVQLAATEEFAQIKAEVDLSLITAPRLAVSGGRDLPDFREIAERLPGALHFELPWAGHLPSLERPAEVTELLLRELP